MTTRTPAWAKGMRKLGPGCYVDSSNALHVSEQEICEHMNVRYTAENSRIVEEVVKEVLREVFGKVPPATHHRDKGAFMNILEFTCLREGFTPSELGLPDSVLDGAGSQPLSLRYEFDHNAPPLYRVNFRPRSDRPAEAARVKGATA